MRFTIELGKASKTRFPGLGFRKWGKSWWVVDLDGEAEIGAPYASKAELLADLGNFAEARGYTL